MKRNVKRRIRIAYSKLRSNGDSKTIKEERGK